MFKFKKTDEQLLAEAAALDSAYADAELFDLRKENEYLRIVLRDLYDIVQADILNENYSKHLNSVMNEAAEALGLFDQEEMYNEQV